MMDSAGDTEEDDIFGSVVFMDSDFADDGRKMGRRVSEAQGVQEAERLGKVKGNEVGSEVGFIQGCCIVWDVLRKRGSISNKRALSHLEKILQMLETFPISEPLTEDIVEQMVKIRAKFKLLSTLIGVRPCMDETEEKKLNEHSF
jgi:hypothetical protein